MMKTIEQFFAEIKENEALQKAFQAAVENGTAEAFLKEQQVDATLAELEAYGKAKSGELSDEELDNAAGGGCEDTPDRSYARRKACRWDANGNATHWYALDYATGQIDMIVYFTCPKCGGMLHEGFGYKLFCDPCDTSYNDYFDNVDVHKIY